MNAFGQSRRGAGGLLALRARVDLLPRVTLRFSGVLAAVALLLATVPLLLFESRRRLLLPERLDLSRRQHERPQRMDDAAEQVILRLLLRRELLERHETGVLLLFRVLDLAVGPAGPA